MTKLNRHTRSKDTVEKTRLEKERGRKFKNDSKVWTHGEMDQLLVWWFEGKSIDFISNNLERPRKSIERKVNGLLGGHHNKHEEIYEPGYDTVREGKSYNSREHAAIERLRNKGYDFEQIASFLGRTRQAVEKEIKKSQQHNAPKLLTKIDDEDDDECPASTNFKKVSNSNLGGYADGGNVQAQVELSVRCANSGLDEEDFATWSAVAKALDREYEEEEEEEEEADDYRVSLDDIQGCICVLEKMASRDTDDSAVIYQRAIVKLRQAKI